MVGTWPDAADGNLVVNRSHTYTCHGSAAHCAYTRARFRDCVSGNIPLRSSYHFSFSRWLYSGSCYAALGSSPPHCLNDAQDSWQSTEAPNCRLHVGDGLPEHVGEQYSNRNHDAAYRFVGYFDDG